MTTRIGRPRVLLSRTIILDAAFRVVDADEATEITMSRLGRELDADPSAMYRHFRNKDELLLAMADVMLQESLDAFEPADDPVENLRRMTWGLRRAYLRRPGLARAVTSRFTGGEAEAACVRQMLHDVGELGYDADESVARVRAIAEMTLGHISMTADALRLPQRTQSFELQMARSYYTWPIEPAPAVTPMEQRLAQFRDGDEVFDTMLETILAGLTAQAPSRPGRRPRSPEQRSASTTARRSGASTPRRRSRTSAASS
jgi:AcrR family transcriptional regulator